MKRPHLSASVKVKVLASGLIGAIIIIGLVLAAYGAYLQTSSRVLGPLISIMIATVLAVGFLELINVLTRNQIVAENPSVEISKIRFIIIEYHNHEISGKVALKIIECLRR